MQLSLVVEGLQEDLTRLAGLGDEVVEAAASRLVAAMGDPATIRLIDLLGDAAAEIGHQLPSGSVELRISGRDADLVYVDDTAVVAGADFEDDQSARISLRLSEQLKMRIEEAAAREGVSANSWIVRALSRSASREGPKQSRKRLTGYGWA